MTHRIQGAVIHPGSHLPDQLLQQDAVPSCIGGHGTLPYEQNTQQSPGFGLISSPHLSQAWKKQHASTGIVISAPTCPQ